MNSWNEGYFTDSTYTFGYYRDINPTWQKFCLLTNGFAADESDENSAHCELGYGQGVSANIHAAATPGKFFGTDFNPSHAAHANELCRASNCGANFFDDSFEEILHRDDLPKFDSISLHGIWSWISTENQNHVVEFARKFLKPGGIFYNSYNCYPGWAPGAPMRELFVLFDKYAHNGTGGGGKTFERVEAAIKFTEEIFNKNPAYFQRVPDVKKIFENTKKHDHNYLAHEYFNREWICMYFSDVAEIMQAAKLDFACTSEVIEAIEHFNFPKDTLDFLNKIENPIMKEQVKDYFVSRQFRKDIYVRGVRKISDLERAQRLIDTNYILMTKNFPQKVKLPMGELTLPQALMEKIFEYLSAENYSFKNFADFAKKNPAIQSADLVTGLVLLVHSGSIQPCQSEESVRRVKNNCVNLNKFICNRAKVADEVKFLASPVLGGGYPLGRFERIFLAAAFDGKNSADEMANYIWEISIKQGQRLTKGNKILATAEENISEFKNMAQNFLDNILPQLKNLQII